MKAKGWLIGSTLCGVLCVTAALAVDLRTMNGVPVVSGGIGSEERTEMTKALPDYNLKVTTAAKGSGAYLAGVAIEVRDARGSTVFDSVLDGPWLFTRLPAGTYELRLTYANQTQKKTVTIPAEGKRDAFFYWESAGSSELKASPGERQQAAQ
jgi:hypothetical protein